MMAIWVSIMILTNAAGRRHTTRSGSEAVRSAPTVHEDTAFLGYHCIAAEDGECSESTVRTWACLLTMCSPSSGTGCPVVRASCDEPQYPH